MTLPLDAAIGQLLRAYQDGQNLALLFDYDGTLTPIVQHPNLARLGEGTVALLRRLTNRPRIGLGIISGRMLAELKELVSIPNVCLAGTSGLEIDLHGQQIFHPRAEEAIQLMSNLVHNLQQRIAHFTGAWLENKRLGLTVHYRAVAAQSHASLQTTVSDALTPFHHQIRVVQGPMALEITPDLGWSKSTAVSLMVQSFAAPGNGVFYAGDGANDADALATVAALGGIAMGVGPQVVELTDYYVPDPAALLDLLATLDSRLDLKNKQ